MEHEEQVVFELENNALSESVKAGDQAALDGCQGRVDRAQQERRNEAYFSDELPYHAGAKRVKI